MKKSLAFVLAMVVVLSLSVAAFAGNGSAHGGTTDPGAVAPLPAAKTTAVLTQLTDADSLTADAKATFEAAYAEVEEVTPDGYTAQYFCYASATEYPAEVAVEITNSADVVAKLYANGGWQDLACSVNGGKVTITLPCEGALAIFTK